MKPPRTSLDSRILSRDLTKLFSIRAMLCCPVGIDCELCDNGIVGEGLEIVIKAKTLKKENSWEEKPEFSILLVLWPWSWELYARSI